MNSNDPFIATLNNLGMAHQIRVVDKAKEVADLIAIKASSLLSLDDQTKTTICIDIACEIMQIPFDSGAAIKMSSIKKTEYKKTKNMMKKLINLENDVSELGVSKLLMKLGVCNSNIEKTAKEILAQFHNNEVVIPDHPQFVALSCYLACKINKEKVLKKAFIAASNLRPLQWTKLEKKYENVVSTTQKSKGGTSTEVRDEPRPEKLKRKLISSELEVEDYDVWKARTLKQARAAIEAKKTAKI